MANAIEWQCPYAICYISTKQQNMISQAFLANLRRHAIENRGSSLRIQAGGESTVGRLARRKNAGWRAAGAAADANNK